MTESLSDAQREEYARFFKDADVNNDGILTIHELSDMLKKLGFKRTNDEIVEMFLACDKNKDTEVSFDEFMSEMGKRNESERTEAEMRKFFKDFDANGDGTISRDELQKGLAKFNVHRTEIEIEEMIKRIDANGDGVISYDEFLTECF